MPDRGTDRKKAQIEQWRARNGSADTPVFAQTVHDVSTVTGDHNTSAQDLSAAIGHDASLSARMVKIANSTLFNPQNRAIGTISEAVVMMGFDAVRELAMSIALIEHVLAGREHARLSRAMARAFHAAVHAKTFAAMDKDACPEEVFVASLLMPVGEMAFWSSGGEDVNAVERLFDAGMPLGDALQRELGFDFSDLSANLAEEWQLGALLQACLSGDTDDTRRVEHVQLSQQIAQVVDEYGWESREAGAILDKIGQRFNLPAAQVEQAVRDNVKLAHTIAEQYGMAELSSALPELPPEDVVVGSEAAQLERERDYRLDTANAQLQSLQNIASGLAQGATLDDLMREVLDGVHRGVAFDRTYFALLTPDRKGLQAKYVLGSNPEGFQGTVRRFEPKRADLLASVLKSAEAQVLTPGEAAVSDHNMGWFAFGECVMAPIELGGKAIGLLYADRARSRKPVSDEDLSAFKLFAQQIVTILTQIQTQAAKAS